MSTPIQVTGGGIIQRAFRLAGILRGPVRGLSGSQQTEGVVELNALIDSLKAKRGAIYAIGQFDFPINANQQQYSIGLDTSGGIPDWEIERPEVIEQAGFLWINTQPVIETPFEIFNAQTWAALSPKDLQSNQPYYMYYRPLTPNGQVEIWPIPTSNWAIRLYLWVSVGTISGVDDLLQMPNAYLDALTYNLAVRLAPMYQQFKIDPEVRNQARVAWSAIMAINDPALLVQCEGASLSGNQAYRYGGGYDPISNRYK